VTLEIAVIVEGDLESIVSQLGGDLSTPYQFIRVAEAMAELGLDDHVLTWSTRGIQQTRGWQVAQLYDLACAVHTRRARPLEVLALRRAQHAGTPSSSTYRALRAAAESPGAWAVEQDAARATLQRADVRAFVDALLGDGETELGRLTGAVSGTRPRTGRGCPAPRTPSVARPIISLTGPMTRRRSTADRPCTGYAARV
jgi:uncharacterized Zn finger protein